DVQVNVLYHILDLICKRDQIDLRSSAGRARYDLNAAFSESQRLQDLLCRLDLLEGISGQRHADRIPDALVQDQTQANRGLDISREERTSLRDAHMERMVHMLGQK